MSDKKISELQFTSSIDANDASILVRNDADLQYTFSTLLQFISNNISTGANFSFGRILPSNLTGKNGDIFVNTATGSFAQKVSGAWSVSFTIASPTVTNSSEILYGLGTPITSSGNNGDTYINTGTGIFYQKSSGAWSQVFSMQNGPAGATGARGADGLNGANGKTILHGNADPSNDLGVDGDFYLNTANYSFFGPKASGIWPTGFSIIGFGVPQGGTQGQLLIKNSTDDYDAIWADGGFVPYRGAASDVDLGIYSLTTPSIFLSNAAGGGMAQISFGGGYGAPSGAMYATDGANQSFIGKAGGGLFNYTVMAACVPGLSSSGGIAAGYNGHIYSITGTNFTDLTIVDEFAMLGGVNVWGSGQTFTNQVDFVSNDGTQSSALRMDNDGTFYLQLYPANQYTYFNQDGTIYVPGKGDVAFGGDITTALESYVSYSGARNDVDLGEHDIVANSVISKIRAINGTPTNPAYTFDSAQDYGLYKTGTGVALKVAYGYIGSYWDYNVGTRIASDQGIAWTNTIGDATANPDVWIYKKNVGALGVGITYGADNASLSGNNFNLGSIDNYEMMAFGNDISFIKSHHLDGSQDDIPGWQYGSGFKYQSLYYNPGINDRRFSVYRYDNTTDDIAFLSDLTGSMSVSVDRVTNQIIAGQKKFTDLLTALDVEFGGYFITGRADIVTSDLSFFYSSPYGGLMIGFNRSSGIGETDYISKLDQFEGATGGHRFMGINSLGEETILLDVDGVGNVIPGNAVPSVSPEGVFVFESSTNQLMKRSLLDIFSDITGDVEETDAPTADTFISITKNGIIYKLLAVTA